MKIEWTEVRRGAWKATVEGSEVGKIAKLDSGAWAWATFRDAWTTCDHGECATAAAAQSAVETAAKQTVHDTDHSI